MQVMDHCCVEYKYGGMAWFPRKLDVGLNVGPTIDMKI